MALTPSTGLSTMKKEMDRAVPVSDPPLRE
jgi:hypothetical protein